MPKKNFLIEEVRKQEILWNRNHPDFTNRGMVHKAWSVVARNSGIPRADIKKKWRNLRDNFIKELKKSSASQTQNVEKIVESYTGKWLHFHQLLFLLETPEKDNTQTNASTSYDPLEYNSSFDFDLNDENTELEEITDEQYYATKQEREKTPKIESFAQSSPPQSPSPPSQRMRPRQSLVSNMLSDFNNENALFLSSLLPFMNKLNTVQQLKVRNKFQHILLDELSDKEF